MAERAAAAYAETLDATLHIQIYGPLDPDLLASFRAQTGDAVEVTIATEHLGGFTRSPQRPGRDHRRLTTPSVPGAG